MMVCKSKNENMDRMSRKRVSYRIVLLNHLMTWSVSQPSAPLWSALPVVPLQVPLPLATPSLLLILITLSIVLILFQNATRYSRSGLPGPPTLPIVGSLPWLARNQPPKVALGQLAGQYGPIFEMNFGMRRMVIGRR